MPLGGHPNGVKYERKKGSNKGVYATVSKGNEEREKSLAGRVNTAHRLPSKIRSKALCVKPARQALVYIDGNPVKLKPEKKRPSNRKGKRVYKDEVITCLRLIWTFFWFKCVYRDELSLVRYHANSRFNLLTKSNRLRLAITIKADSAS